MPEQPRSLNSFVWVTRVVTLWLGLVVRVESPVRQRGEWSTIRHMATTAIHLDRLLEPFAGCLSPDVAAKVAALRADDTMQERIDYLAQQSNEGLLTAAERDEYAGYLHAIDVIAVLQAKARALLRKA